MPTVFLSLGSNLGDRKTHLDRAVELLKEQGLEVLRCSTIYETEPVECLDQPHFLNQVICLQTSWTPQDLLELCLEIETTLGRTRTIQKGPRTIDLDLLLYDDWIVSEPSLTIPHPRLHLRRFVLAPLASLAGEATHPVLQQSIAQLLANCPDSSQVTLFLESPK